MSPESAATLAFVSLAALVTLAACAPTVDLVAGEADDASGVADAPLDAILDAQGPDVRDASMDTISPLPDAGPADVAQPLDAGLDVGAPLCASAAATSLYIVETGGQLLRFTPMTGDVTPLGVPDCLKSLGAIVSLAVDVQGLAWLFGSSGAVFTVDVTSTPLACKQPPAPFKLPPSAVAMTFLPAPTGARPPLYVADGASLLAIDTKTGIEAPVGSLSGTGILELSGTADGRLFAVRQAMTKPLSAALDLLDPGDASVMSTLTVPLGGAATFVGGVALGGSFYLFADSFYFTMDLGTGKVNGPMKALMPFMGVVALAAAPCA